ncbi:MAG: tetratricopeptide repeat protein [Phycisphaerae bacterium]
MQVVPANRDAPQVINHLPVNGYDLRQLELVLRDEHGDILLQYLPEAKSRWRTKAPLPATEPPLPADVKSNDELYLIGLHLDQYRHATRYPETYWREALRRDPGDSRCLNAMGLWHLKRGEFTFTREHFQRAINRLTGRNSNPYDGEAFYNLGLARRFLGDDAAAYDAFYKSTWNQAWQAPAFLELARIDCQRGNWTMALEHLDQSLVRDADNLNTRNLKSVVLQKLGRSAEANVLLENTGRLDPLDGCCRFLRGALANVPTQERLDLSLDFARAGLWENAMAVLPQPEDAVDNGAAPLVHYYRGYFHQRAGQWASAKKSFLAGAKASPDWCFPSRLEEILILETAIAVHPMDGYAHYYLGNLMYDRKRHREAIRNWEIAARLKPDYAVIWRNLGIGYFNVLKQPANAARAYQKARQCNPADARLLYEQDQLGKRIGWSIDQRLSTLRSHVDLVQRRDDLSIEYCTLLNLTRNSAEALAILQSRRFQPWEGGEGRVLEQYVRANMSLGRTFLRNGKPTEAMEYFRAALKPPENLGEARHPLANCSDIYFYLGQAQAALGRKTEAQQWWHRAAQSRGDFRQMAVTACSELTLYSALALRQLGRLHAAEELLRAILAHAEQLARTPATIDYFATSLPTLLLFETDMQEEQTNTALFLKAQVYFAQENNKQSGQLLATILRSDSSHALASELLAEVSNRRLSSMTAKVRKADRAPGLVGVEKRKRA